MEKLIDALKDLRSAVPFLASEDKVPVPFSRNRGICGNVGIYLDHRFDEKPALRNPDDHARMRDEHYRNSDAVEDQLGDLIYRWPGRCDNSKLYPIGGHDEYCEEVDLGTTWLNPRRLELLDWLISELEAE